MQPSSFASVAYDNLQEDLVALDPASATSSTSMPTMSGIVYRSDTILD